MNLQLKFYKGYGDYKDFYYCDPLKIVINHLNTFFRIKSQNLSYCKLRNTTRLLYSKTFIP